MTTMIERPWLNLPLHDGEVGLLTPCGRCKERYEDHLARVGACVNCESECRSSRIHNIHNCGIDSMKDCEKAWKPLTECWGCECEGFEQDKRFLCPDDSGEGWECE